MMSSLLGDVRNYTSMHAYTITEQDPRQVEVSSMPIEFTTGAVGRRLQHPGCGRSMRSHHKEIHGVSILIPLEADISIGRLHHPINGLHHYGVEGTTACQGSSWIHSIRRHSSNTSHISTDRMKKKMEESIPDWSRRVDWSKHPKRAHFSNTIQELKAVSTATTSSKYFQALTQAFDQVGYSLSTV